MDIDGDKADRFSNGQLLSFITLLSDFNSSYVCLAIDKH